MAGAMTRLLRLLGLNRVDDFADAELEHPEVALWLGPEPPPANLSPATLAAGFTLPAAPTV
jgi:hypothetical protein